MTDDSCGTLDLLHRASRGDQAALETLFSAHRDRLKLMVRLRLNQRLRRRVDESDVVQEAFLDVARRLTEYARAPRMPFFLWLRHLTGLKLTEVHRRHLGSRLRDAAREVPLNGGAPPASSVSLAARLVGRLTSPSQKAVKAEMRLQLQGALGSMDAVDREVLTLRHFEQLDNGEIAQILGISESGASSRYLRAIKKLRGLLAAIPGFLDE